MKAKTNVKKMAILAMMVALGVVLSPILRVPGMAPMQHFINVIGCRFAGAVVRPRLAQC